VALSDVEPELTQKERMAREPELLCRHVARLAERIAHKLSTEILDFVAQRRIQDPSLRVAALLELIQETFGIRVHRRTLERALIDVKKNLINHRDCAELLRPSKWTYRTLRGASPTGLIKKPVFGFAVRSSGARKSRGSSVDGGSKPKSRFDFASSLEQSHSAIQRA
jgi:hypothetical protein